MRGISLFAGAGGLDLGLELAGHEILVAVENEPAAARVHRERFPGTLLLDGDVRDVRWEDYAAWPYDFVVAGFPCPDFSVAGSRKGMAGDKGALWHEVVRALRALRPRWVILENVEAIRTAPGMADHPGESALGAVLADLAALRYVGLGVRMGACDVGAPHLRYRVFYVAALADAVGGGIDPDSGVRRGDAGGGDRPEREALPAGEEVALAEIALADRPSSPADAGQLGFEEPVERVRGEAGRGRPRGSAERREAPADAVGLAGEETGELDVRSGASSGSGEEIGRATGRASDAAPDADGEGLEGLGPEPGEGSDEGEADGTRAPALADSGRERGEPRRRRRTTRRRSSRRDSEEPDAGDRQPRSPEPRTDAGGAEASPDPDRERSRRSERGVEGGGWRGRAPSDPEAPADADGGGRGVVGVEEPAGVAGARGSQPDGRDALRELGDASIGDGPENGTPTDWGAFGEAIERWEYLLGRPAPAPTDERGRLVPEFVEWMMGFPDGWTAVEGVPRTKRLMMLGNAVQVQCGQLVGEWLSHEAEAACGN